MIDINWNSNHLTSAHLRVVKPIFLDANCLPEKYVS